MATIPDDIIDATMKLPEAHRLLIATRLLDALPADLPGLLEDDPGFIDELERRARDTEATIPAAELWTQE